MTGAKFVAEFQKDARGPLRLWVLTVWEKDKRDGLTARHEYHVTWSRKYGCYLFDLNGFGGDDHVQVMGIYYARGDVRIKELPTSLVDGKDCPPYTSPETLAIRERNATRRLRRLPGQFTDHRGDLLAWLQEHGINQEAVWCSECQDELPADELCEHMWWCEEISWYSTPSERCGCAVRAFCHGDKPAEEEAFSPAHPRLLQYQWWE